jgi:hypothetical protein
MALMDLRVWLKDRFYDRELLSAKTMGLEEAANMLSSPKIEISDLLFDFKDTNHLADSPSAFVKKYFKPEDNGYDNIITYSILRSRGDGAVHRLSFAYIMNQEKTHEPSGLGFPGMLMNHGILTPHDNISYDNKTNQSYRPRTIRRAIIDFYDIDGIHVLSREAAISKLTPDPA